MRWLNCVAGAGRHWGPLGAAGVLLVHDGECLLGLRSGWVDKPGTIGVPGGAINRGESAWQAAARELVEETGIDAPDARGSIRGAHADTCPACDAWCYTTFVVRHPLRATPGTPDRENVRFRWVPLELVGSYRRLHPGLASAWPALLEIASL